MKKDKPLKNIALSVRARLLNIAKQQNLNYSLVLLQYIQERFLYRVSISPYKDNFILKGGLLFIAYHIKNFRPTKDIDLLGLATSNDLKNIKKIIFDICNIHCDDGVIFILDTITVDKINENTEHEGVRVKIKSDLGGAKEYVQIDIGFGDKIIPGSVEIDYPVLLDNPIPKIYVYSYD